MKLFSFCDSFKAGHIFLFVIGSTAAFTDQIEALTPFPERGQVPPEGIWQGSFLPGPLDRSPGFRVLLL